MGKLAVVTAASLLAALLAGAGGAAPERLEITGTGDLVATLHSAEGGAVVAFDFVKDGCSFSPDHTEPCFTFTAVNGTDSIPVSGCVSNADAHLGVAGTVGCPAKNVKSITLILAEGGIFNLYGGNGEHNDCSPAPVTIEAKGGTYHIGAWNGCTETISCTGGAGEVDADKSDVVKGNCNPGFVTRH